MCILSVHVQCSKQSLGSNFCDHEVNHGAASLLGDDPNSLFQCRLYISCALDSATPRTSRRDRYACIIRHFWAEANAELSCRSLAS